MQTLSYLLNHSPNIIPVMSSNKLVSPTCFGDAFIALMNAIIIMNINKTSKNIATAVKTLRFLPW